ncbi:MAG TPA: twin-arginine translocase TatA/TatE family subunit [Acidimicrobiia bacterium]|nr:twin-arginine translocase TatA/TatE family subunit [Acidimicrobiia bacterium]
MFNIGPLELLAILVVALLVFGPEKLPEMGKQVGKAMREFKKFQESMQANAREIIDPIAGPIISNGPLPTNISGGPIPTENNVPRSATIQNPEPPEGEAVAPPGTFGHYAPVEPPTPGDTSAPAAPGPVPAASGGEAAAPGPVPPAPGGETAAPGQGATAAPTPAEPPAPSAGGAAPAGEAHPPSGAPDPDRR